MSLSLSLTEARALTLEAQGLTGNPDKTVLDVIKRLGLIQIDSVNVFERAHYMPLFSRLGAYDKTELDALTVAGGSKHAATADYPELIEYWAHEASFIRVEDWPLYKWRMHAHRNRIYLKDKDWVEANADLLQWLQDELRTKGPLTSSQIDHDRNKRKGTWWGWSDVKRGLEFLFVRGHVVSAGRDKFNRRYGLAELVLPKHVFEAEPDAVGARVTLLAQAARTLGVATAKDLADYHRMRQMDLTAEFEALVESGEILPAQVEGWAEPTYVHKSWVDHTPAKPNRTTLVSPFDPLVWRRERASALFGFDYKIEIYVPQPNRVYGYYTLPLLHNGRVLGRIDLKSERKTRELLVQATWHEPSVKPSELDAVARATAKHLEIVKKWQGLDSIVVANSGNFAPAVSSALKN